MNTTSFPTERFSHLSTPFYYYDTALLQATLDELRRVTASHPAFHVHYAIKANAHPQLLAQIAAAGLGADCVSGGEVTRALQCGFAPKSIVFAGVGKTDEEIRLALRAGIARFNVESLEELEVIGRIAEEMDVEGHVAFRINPNIDAHTHAKITTGTAENKFGIPARDLRAAIDFALDHECLHFDGLHFHLGSQILDMDVFRRLCLYVNDLQDRLEADGYSLPTINVGGGLGINYDEPDSAPVPDFASYFATFADHLRLRPGQQLHFELGRSIVAQCGSLIARVLYVKRGEERNFLIVDAGFTELIRPAMYGSLHHVDNLTPRAGAVEHYDIVGPICESSDVFARGYALPAAGRGDLIAFRSAGAYGEVMASGYNCRPLPPAVFSGAERAE